MANKSILRHGYMAAVLAELKRDAGKLWRKPRYDGYSVIFDDLFIEIFPGGKAWLKPGDGPFGPYTPARFRAALRRIKQKGK